MARKRYTIDVVCDVGNGEDAVVENLLIGKLEELDCVMGEVDILDVVIERDDEED